MGRSCTSVYKKKMIIGASIGNCVHVAGIYHFLQLAEKEGYEVKFLGPAVSIDRLFDEINNERPSLVAISYRLTPQNVIPLLEDIVRRAKMLDYKPEWEFGGTKPVADIARNYNFFSFISDGYDDITDSIRFLRGNTLEDGKKKYGSNLIERINMSRPYPILRHHFGLPNLEETIQGIEKISEARVLDVISLGPDQNAQEFFFNQKNMRKEYDGAGGVPVRAATDFCRLKQASERGNYPLMRCYSGTADVFSYARLLVDTIDNAWAAIPLYWYNELDGRGTRTIETSIREAQRLIKWHSENNIPVEINEPHHWGLRDAHDVIPVFAAYISAYNAKQLGVKNYVAQYMFNNPNGLSFSMDLARVLAMQELVESLQDENFKIYRESRAGLPLFNADPYVAKGQLAASTFMQMCIKPHIIHVVGYCEADHAATAEEVIESCKIVRGVVRHTQEEQFSIENSEKIVKRKNELISEAKVLLDFIFEKYGYSADTFSNPDILADIVKRGYLDAAHIVKGDKFRGDLVTTFVNGSCMAYDKSKDRVIDERERLKHLEELNERLDSKQDGHIQKGA